MGEWEAKNVAHLYNREWSVATSIPFFIIYFSIIGIVINEQNK